jgi:predicted N-acetyltransferase YhbS
MGLAPVAVLPGRQRRGIEMLKIRGCPFIIVLGHAESYPHFGFVHASVYDMVWPGTETSSMRPYSRDWLFAWLCRIHEGNAIEI